MRPLLKEDPEPDSGAPVRTLKKKVVQFAPDTVQPLHQSKILIQTIENPNAAQQARQASALRTQTPTQPLQPPQPAQQQHRQEQQMVDAFHRQAVPQIHDQMQQAPKISPLTARPEPNGSSNRNWSKYVCFACNPSANPW
jgi:hypothetical protein